MADRAKKQSIIYSNLVESMLDGEIDVKETWPKTTDLISIIAIALSGLNTLLIIWLIYKSKNIAYALLASRPVHASSSMIFHYTTLKPETETHWAQLLSSYIEWDHAIFAFSTLILICAIIIIFKLSRRTNSHTQLCLEITTGSECILLVLRKLPLCPFYWKIEYPTMIDNLRLTGQLNPHLHVNWPGFNVTNKATGHKIDVPNVTRISFFQARRLKHMFKRTFCAYIILIHHGIRMPLNENEQVNQKFDTPPLYPSLM